MKTDSLRILYLLPILALLVTGGLAYAAEHPSEHPAATGTTEHPTAARPAAISLDKLAAAISDYVAKDTKLKGGHFLVWDAKQKKPLALKLVRVHKDRLSKVSEGLYFACSDFRATDGRMYDLDFFMRQTPSGLMVTEITIHKQAGKPRYNWVQEGGVWKRK